MFPFHCNSKTNHIPNTATLDDNHKNIARQTDLWVTIVRRGKQPRWNYWSGCKCNSSPNNSNVELWMFFKFSFFPFSFRLISHRQLHRPIRVIVQMWNHRAMKSMCVPVHVSEQSVPPTMTAHRWHREKSSENGVANASMKQQHPKTAMVMNKTHVIYVFISKTHTQHTHTDRQN